MAALEVSVAVSAVASAFHSGAELLKQLKKQRKKRRGEDAYREKALLESLENAETKIEERYALDTKELGQSVRIGDAIAREHLLHIAVSLQSDVIRSLQIATRNESAVVDLTALHEASVMLRRDTLNALAELRQRLINELPQDQRSRLNSRNSLSSTQRSSLSNSQRSRSSSNFSDNLPPAVTIVHSHDEKPKGVLHRVFSHRRSSSALTGYSSNSSNSEKRHSGYSTFASNMPWLSNRRSLEHPDTVSPQSHELPADVPPRLRPPMDAAPPIDDAPPPPAYSPNRRFNRSAFELDKKVDPSHFPMPPRPIHPLERESMSQDELESLNLAAALTHRVSSPQSDDDTGLRPTSWMSSGASVSSRSHYSTAENAAEDTATVSSATFSADECASLSLAAPPAPRPRHSYTSIQNSSPFTASPPHNELTSPPPTDTPKSPSHTRAPTVTVIPPPSTPTSVPMLGRPCKANNYYNFCKGAWTLREEFKKGMSARTKAVGMYTSMLVWQCRCCSFEGPTFGARKPFGLDPHAYKYAADNGVVVQYKWVFLAKSHVRVKSGRGDVQVEGEARYLRQAGYSYGCTFCCAEGKVTGVYGNAETLLGHVAEAHAPAGMSAEVQARTKCVVGRAPAKGEEWDVCFA